MDSSRIGAAPSPLTIVGILAFVGAAWLFSDDIAAAMKKWGPPAARKQATVTCPRPSEFETLLVYINADAHRTQHDIVRLRVRCGLVGGAGAYSRGRN